MTIETRTPHMPTPSTTEAPPVGLPDDPAVTLDPNDAYTLFKASLDAIYRWEEDSLILENEAAHRRLLLLVDALRITTEAQLRQMAPLVAASREDDAAAAAWRDARWSERFRTERRVRTPKPGQNPGAGNGLDGAGGQA